MAHGKILVIEDNPDILELVRYHLLAQGYSVLRAGTGENGIALAVSELPDLVILDVMLPGIDGLEVFRHLRGTDETRSIPVVLLTARSDETDVVNGFELGVDDYIPKPFSPRILVARVRSLLRKRGTLQGDSPSVVQVHGITLDRLRHQVSVNGTPRALSATEFSILEQLMTQPGKVFSRSEIIEGVQGDASRVTPRSVDVHIVGLRKELGVEGDKIETIRGVGYRVRSLA